jgi:hypothetical protein
MLSSCPFINEAIYRHFNVYDDSGKKGITKRLVVLAKTCFKKLGESSEISTIIVPSIPSVYPIEWLDEKTVLVPCAAQCSDFSLSNNRIVFVSTSGAAILGIINE